MSIKTLADVKNIADFMRHTHIDELGELFKAVKGKFGHISGRDFMACSRVSCDRALPETALLDCPAADDLMVLRVDLQKEHVIERKPFTLVDRNNLDNVLLKTYDQLTNEDCELLFAGVESEKLRAFGKALDDPKDKAIVEFKNGKFQSFTHVHRDKPRRRK